MAVIGLRVLKVIGRVNIEFLERLVNNGQLVRQIIIKELFFQLFEGGDCNSFLLGEQHFIYVGNLSQNISPRTFELLHEVFLNFEIEPRSEGVIRVSVNIQFVHDFVIRQLALS